MARRISSARLAAQALSGLTASNQADMGRVDGVEPELSGVRHQAVTQADVERPNRGRLEAVLAARNSGTAAPLPARGRDVIAAQGRARAGAPWRLAALRDRSDNHPSVILRIRPLARVWWT